jgi:hypothetical protein
MSPRDAFALQGSAAARSVAASGVVSMLSADRHSLTWFFIMFGLEMSVGACTLSVTTRAGQPIVGATDVPWSSVVGASFILLVHYVYPIMAYSVVRSVVDCEKTPDVYWRPFPSACADVPLVPALLVGVLTVVVMAMFFKFAPAYYSCVRTKNRRGFVANAVVGATTVQCIHAVVWLWFLWREDTSSMGSWRVYSMLAGAGSSAALFAFLAVLSRSLPNEYKEVRFVMWYGYVLQGLTLAGGAFNAVTLLTREVTVEHIVLVCVLGITGLEFIAAFVSRLASIRMTIAQEELASKDSKTNYGYL